MLDWSHCPTVERVPGKVSGIWLFKGTRVPVKALFENLEDGASVDDFLAWFPGVTREQVEAVLQHAERRLAVAERRRRPRLSCGFSSIPASRCHRVTTSSATAPQ